MTVYAQEPPGREPPGNGTDPLEPGPLPVVLPQPELSARGLSVTIKGRRILHIPRICFRPGITAIVGPNGAGKTTLLRVLAGLLPLAGGRIIWRGRDLAGAGTLRAYRRQLGYLPQEFTPYHHMTIREFVAHAAAMKGIPAGAGGRAEQVDRALSHADIEELAHRRPHELSSGQIRAVGLAQALVNRPEILILDEPLRGLDGERRQHMSRLLTNWGQNRPIVMSAHGSELDHVPARWLLLVDGGIRLDAEGGELIHASHGRLWEVFTRPAGRQTPSGQVSSSGGPGIFPATDDDALRPPHTGETRGIVSISPRGSGWRLQMLLPPGAGSDCAARMLPPTMSLLWARPAAAGAETAYLTALADYYARRSRRSGPTSRSTDGTFPYLRR